MRAGELRHRVVVDELVTIQNATGEPVPDWTPRAKVWASVEPLAGREYFQAGQFNASIDTRICIRWSPTVDQIKPTWRIRHEETIYNIVSVAHLKFARREIEIMAKTGVNDG